MEENVTEVKVDKVQSDLVARALQKSSGQPVYSINEINERLAQTPAQEETVTPTEVVNTESTTTSAAPEAAESEEDKKFYEFFEKKVGKKWDDAKSAFERKAFEEELKEKLGKPYEEVEKAVKTPSRELKSEYSKKLEDWIEKGGIEKDFHDLQRQNWEEMAHEDIIKADLKAKYPNADKAKIDILYKSEYKLPKELDPDTHTEEEVAERNEEIEAAKLRLELKADEIRQSKIAQRVKALEVPVRNEVKLTPEQEAEQARIQAQAEANGKRVFEDWANTKGLTLKVSEKIDGKDVVSELSFDLEKEQRDRVDYILQNPTERLMESFFDKDGNLDSKSFIKAVTLFVAGEKAAEKMAKDLAHERLEAHIKGLKNANFKGAEVVMPKTDQAKRSKELTDRILGRI